MLKTIIVSFISFSLAVAGCNEQNESSLSNDTGAQSISSSDDSIPAGCGFSSGSVSEQVASHQPDSAIEFEKRIRPLLEQFCIDCHAPGEMEELDFLVARTESDVAGLQEVYASVLEQMESGNMPPEDSDQLSDTERRLVIDWIRKTIPPTTGQD